MLLKIVDAFLKKLQGILKEITRGIPGKNSMKNSWRIFWRICRMCIHSNIPDQIRQRIRDKRRIFVFKNWNSDEQFLEHFKDNSRAIPIKTPAERNSLRYSWSKSVKKIHQKKSWEKFLKIFIFQFRWK